jgi:YVTN family beta-propeller protein
MNTVKQLFSVATIAILFGACKKAETIIPDLPIKAVSNGAYVLSEGNIGSNNTKLSFYSLNSNSFVGDFFLQQNPNIPGGLGDTGNDAIIYGSKMYVILNSDSITVLNAANATFIKKIFIGTFSGPRYAASARGKVYVTASNNTVNVVDTLLLKKINTIQVGNNPEGIAASANYLYVANSGGFNFPNFDSTVSLIDLNTETEIRKIKVGVNPNKVEINQGGNIFVSAYGNYSNKPASISVIDGAINLTSTNLGPNFAYSHIRIAGDIAYIYNNYGSGGTAKVFNSATNTFLRSEFITDGTVIATPYGINIDELNGDVYIADAKNYVTAGAVTCFSSAGVKKFSFSVAPGVSPNKIVFRR